MFLRKIAIFICPLFILSCNNEHTNQQMKVSLYPNFTDRCHAVPKAEQKEFMDRFKVLKLNMPVNEVVKLLKVKPISYRRDDNKSLNVPIKYYKLQYTLDCENYDQNFIWLKFSIDEKLQKIQFAENINIELTDNSITYQKL